MSGGIIFISYSRRDGADAARIVERTLRARGLTTWRDTRDLDPFRDFTAEIESRIEAASHVVVCITPDSKRDDSFVRREIQYALLADKPIVPVRFVDIPPHISLINYEWVDYFDTEDAALARLCHILKHDAPPGVVQEIHDPFRMYVTALYKHTVAFLQQSVLSLIDLHVDSAAADVTSLTIDRGMLPEFYAGQGLNPANRSYEFENFQGALDAYARRMLVLGAPGSGKTITLMAAARDAAAARLADTTAPLPLLGLVPTWNPVEKPALATWLSAGLPSLSVDAIRNEIESGRALLLLDSLDELGDDYIVWRELASGERVIRDRFDPREHFIAQLPSRGGIVITCRVADFETLRASLPLNGMVALRATVLR